MTGIPLQSESFLGTCTETKWHKFQGIFWSFGLIVLHKVVFLGLPWGFLPLTGSRQWHGWICGYRPSNPYLYLPIPVPVNLRVFLSKSFQEQPNRLRNEWDIAFQWISWNQLWLTQFWSKDYVLGLGLKVTGMAIVTCTRVQITLPNIEIRVFLNEKLR